MLRSSLRISTMALVLAGLVAAQVPNADGAAVAHAQVSRETIEPTEIEPFDEFGTFDDNLGGDYLLVAVFGVTELRDDQISWGYGIDNPATQPGGLGVTVIVPDDPDTSVTITPADGEVLTVGVFDAVTSGQPESGEVGLHAAGLEERCAQAPIGRIAVQDVDYQNGVLQVLAADFLVSCEEGTRELEGQVRLSTDVAQTPWLWFGLGSDVWSRFGETQQQDVWISFDAGHRITGVVDAAPFEHVSIVVSDEPCSDSGLCRTAYFNSTWLDNGWIATITESPDLPLGRTGFRPTRFRTLDGVFNPTDIRWAGQSTAGVELSINYNANCPACGAGSKHDLVWWRRQHASMEWERLDPSSPDIEQNDRLLTDNSTVPGVAHEYRVTNHWYEDYVLTSDTISATRLLTPVSEHKRGFNPQFPHEVEIETGDLAGVVRHLQTGWSTSGRLANLDSSETSSGAASTADVEACFDGFREDDLNAWRHAGDNRWETALCVSLAMWADHDHPDPDVYKAQAVVLARGDRYEDALSSGPLAAWAQAPLLLTSPTSMRTVVRDEISRVLAPGGLVYLVGGPNAISDEIKSELERAGYQTRRVAGANRYETAVEVARELPNTSNFVFATGRNFPDALSAGTAAAALTVGARETGEYSPFALLLTADELLRPVVADFVLDRANLLGEWTLLTAGGWAEQAVADAFGSDAIEASFTGANRYDTAALIGEGIFAYPDSGELVGLGVGLSTGTNFPDALAATPYLAEFAQPLLLARPDDLRRATRDFLLNHSGEGGIPGQDRWIDVFGGTVAINSSTLRTAVRFF